MKTLYALLLYIVSLAAFGQQTPAVISPNDTVTYSTIDVQVSRNNGQEQYRSNRGVRIFHPKHMALTDILPLDQVGYVLNVARKQLKGVENEPGASWEIKYRAPPRAGVNPACGGSTFDFTSTVEASPEKVVAIEGLDAKLGVYEIQGTWYGCGTSGTFKYVLTYSSDLKAWYSLGGAAISAIKRGPTN